MAMFSPFLQGFGGGNPFSSPGGGGQSNAPQIPQRLPNAGGQQMSGMNMQATAPQRPQPGMFQSMLSNPMGMMQAGMLGQKARGGGGDMWGLPSWLSGTGGTQAIGTTPYGGSMMAPNIAGGNMFGGGMQVGGGLGQPSMMTSLGTNGMADSIPGASGYMSGGGGGLFANPAFGGTFEGAGGATSMLPGSASALTAGGEGAGLFGGAGEMGGLAGFGDLFGMGSMAGLGAGAGEGLLAGGAAEGIGGAIAANPELLLLLA